MAICAHQEFDFNLAVADDRSVDNALFRSGNLPEHIATGATEKILSGGISPPRSGTVKGNETSTAVKEVECIRQRIKDGHQGIARRLFGGQICGMRTWFSLFVLVH